MMWLCCLWRKHMSQLVTLFCTVSKEARSTHFPFPNQFPTQATTDGQPVVCTSPFMTCRKKQRGGREREKPVCVSLLQRRLLYCTNANPAATPVREIRTVYKCFLREAVCLMSGPSTLHPCYMSGPEKASGKMTTGVEDTITPH